MDTHTYPGKGLSLSQLVLALSEELKRVMFSPSFTPDTVSQLDRDISIVLANVREWRNSLVPINRVPLDVLSLIPTHLDSQPDRFHASHVCRHWRRTLLQYASLWTRLFLQKGEVYVKTLLERAKGSPLDVFIDFRDSASTLSLLSPRIRQISYLTFVCVRWEDVQRFSQVNFGLFPLLHALEIDITAIFIPEAPPTTPSALPLFGNVAHLKQFVLHTVGSPFLNHFVFPNITTFELSTSPVEKEFHASELLNFLEASPMLQTVDVKIASRILLEDVAQTKVVVLPNVQTFFLIVDDGGPGYELASHMSCPSASYTSLVQRVDAEDMIPDQDVFPAAALWNTIVSQYTKSPAEVITLEIKHSIDPTVVCALAFQSSDTSFISLGLEVFGVTADTITQGVFLEVFSQAVKAIRNHPLLPNVKRLHIENTIPISELEELTRMVSKVGSLFKSVGPLDELTLSRCDLDPYLTAFLDLLGLGYVGQPITFPPIKELTVLHPPMGSKECLIAIAELAKSQHALGVPFERVTIHALWLPKTMAEMLDPWVGEVDCYVL